MTAQEESAHIIVPSLRGVVTVEVLLNARHLEIESKLAAHSTLAVDLIVLSSPVAEGAPRAEWVVLWLPSFGSVEASTKVLRSACTLEG